MRWRWKCSIFVESASAGERLVTRYRQAILFRQTFNFMFCVAIPVSISVVLRHVSLRIAFIASVLLLCLSNRGYATENDCCAPTTAYSDSREDPYPLVAQSQHSLSSDSRWFCFQYRHQTFRHRIFASVDHDSSFGLLDGQREGHVFQPFLVVS